MGMTLVEKILAKATGQPSVKAGDVLEPKVDLAMSHENAALVINQFSEIYKDTGIPLKVWDPSKIAIIAYPQRVQRQQPTKKRSETLWANKV
jgi:3-isopropylmalate/(R)-2-methylmalate dehydratase large subunit